MKEVAIYQNRFPMLKISKQNIPSLTPLRGIAAFGVFGFHLIHNNLHALQDFFKSVGLYDGITSFYLAVDFFFMLSGYLLCSLYEKDLAEPTLVSICDFYRKRFIRIYPLLLVATTFSLFILRWTTGHWEISKYFHDIALLNSIPRYFPPLKGVSWSLSAEWFAYLIAPFAFFWIARIKKWGWVSALAGGAALLAFMVFMKWGTVDSRTAIRGICGFVIGAGLAGAGIRITDRRLATILFCISGLGFFMTIFYFSFRPISDLVAYGFLAGVLVTSPYIGGVIGESLNGRFLTWLGLISFSLYLWHIPLFEIFYGFERAGLIPVNRGVAGDCFWFLVLSAITLLISHISYRLIEVRGRRWIESKFFKKRMAVV